MAKSPNISWTLDDVPVAITDWSCNSIANGGFDQMRGTLSAAQWKKLSPTAGQGSNVIAYLPNGNVMWEGRLSAPPAIQEGAASIAAQGHKVSLERQTDRRFYMSRDYSLLQAIGDQPFTFSPVDDIDANVRKAGIQLRAEAGVTYAANQLNGVAVWLPDCTITKVRFDAFRPRSLATFEIVVQRFTGPNGARTAVSTTVLNAGGWSGAPGSITVNTGVIASPEDAVRIILQSNAAPTPALPVPVRITDLRIHGLSSTDTWTVQQTLQGLGQDGEGVTPVSRTAFN